MRNLDVKGAAAKGREISAVAWVTPSTRKTSEQHEHSGSPRVRRPPRPELRLPCGSQLLGQEIGDRQTELEISEL